MRRLLAIAAVVLAMPASAHAKGILSAEVCGAEGCRAVSDADESLLGGGVQTHGPTRREPFVRLEVRIGVPGHSERTRVLFATRSELMLGADGRTWMQPLALAELRRMSQRVKPFAASAMPLAALDTPAGAAARAAAADAPLAPEVFEPPTRPASPDGDASAPSSEGGLDAWWLAVAGATIALAAGALLARRRRRGPPTTAAGAMGG